MVLLLAPVAKTVASVTIKAVMVKAGKLLAEGAMVSVIGKIISKHVM